MAVCWPSARTCSLLAINKFSDPGGELDAPHRSVCGDVAEDGNSAFGGESDFTTLPSVPAELHDISGGCDVPLMSFRLGVSDAGRER
jgi:hypothetical protein